jgi:hypothetical protein
MNRLSSFELFSVARAATLAFALISIVGFRAAAQEGSSAAAPLSADEASAIATDAYIYGYSLITTEVTRVQMSNVSKVEGLHAPMGQFINVKRYPPADFRGVSAPNADTPSIRLHGSTCQNPRCSAIQIWASASI